LEEIVQALKERPNFALGELRQIGKLLDGIVPYRDGHSERVSKYALAIARELGFSKRELVMVEATALLHDLGKVGIDEKILCQGSTLFRVFRASIRVMEGFFSFSKTLFFSIDASNLFACLA